MNTPEIFLSSLLILVIILLVTLLYKLKKNNVIIAEKEEEISSLASKKAEIYSELEQQHKEKAQILSTVSHDMKSPFNRIFALTNLLQLEADNLTENQKEYLTIIQSVVSDGLLLIRNMMDMRAIDGNGIEMNLQKLNINAVVNGVVKNSLTYADKKKIKLEYVPLDGKIGLISDKHYLERIVDNVLSNAIKFTPQEGLVKVVLEDLPSEIKIAIQDQGPGIIEEEKHLLYERFGVLSSKPTGGESTNGLGLYVAHSMLNVLGGSIDYETQKVEKGSTFFITLRKVESEN